MVRKIVLRIVKVIQTRFGSDEAFGITVGRRGHGPAVVILVLVVVVAAAAILVLVVVVAAVVAPVVSNPQASDYTVFQQRRKEKKHCQCSRRPLMTENVRVATTRHEAELLSILCLRASDGSSSEKSVLAPG